MGESLVGEIALVTGASRGIGAAVLLALGRAGAQVVGTATSEAGAAAISERLSAEGIEGLGLALDVTQPEQVAATFEAVRARFGAVSLLVNNAGITRDQLLMRMDDEAWEAVIDTNLGSAFRLCRLAVKDMLKARRGRIINIASVVGAMGNAGQCNYAASKAGLIGFSKSLAREVGKRGITVNVVAPGFIETDMTRDLPEAQRAALAEQIVLGRLGSPEDIAGAVLFLAGPSAAYVTGQVLHVNGGLLMP